MSRFTTPLRFEYTDKTLGGWRIFGHALGSRQIFRLTEPFSYEVGAEGSNIWIHAPAGFETDLGSSPWPLWWLVSPTSQYAKAWVLHDLLYRKVSGCSKIVADAICYEALTLLGAPWLIRRLVWDALYYFGHSSYQWESPAPVGTETKMLNPDGEVKPEFKEQEIKNTPKTFQQAVLQELSGGEVSGDRLRIAVGELGHGKPTNAFYREMMKLEKQKLVIGEFNDGNGSGMRTYRITDAGRKAVAK